VDCPIFWVPPIISGTGKTTDFKFCMNIHRVDQNKSARQSFQLDRTVTLAGFYRATLCVARS